MKRPTPAIKRKLKRRKLLLALADKLDTVKPVNFNMCSYDKDALFYAAQMPEARSAGLAYFANENAYEAPEVARVWYQDHSDIAAAAFFFDLTLEEAQHLFSMHEMDLFGYSHKSAFETKRDKGTARDREPPMWAAARIRMFVKEFPNFDTYKAAS